MRELNRSLACILTAWVLASGLAGCGVKGELEEPPPKDEKENSALVLPDDGDETA